MKVLIAEDEPLAARRIAMELERLGDIDIVGPFADGNQAMQGILDTKPDIALMDIQMPGATGFEVLEGLAPEQTPLVIFTTAFKRYAIAAIKAGAIDYLLKPIDGQALERALEKARRRLVERNADVRTGELRSLVTQLRTDVEKTTPYKTEFWVKSKKQNVRVGVHELEVVEAVRDYVLMHTRSHSYLLRGKISNIEQQLNPEQFVRAHRSYIFNLAYVRSARQLSSGGKVICMTSGREVRVGRKYMPQVRKRL